MASSERIEAAGRWLVSMGGSATPGELGAALGGLSNNHQADVIKALRAAGCIAGGKGRLTLTPAGWTRFAAVGPAGAGELLDQVVEQVWPPQLYAHQALFRLVVSATVARWHLREVRLDHHLTFVSRGGEGTGKTSLFRLVCDLLGVEQLEAIVEPGSENAASLGGRRTLGKGSQMIRETPTIATLPLVVFDDADKMPAEVRQAFWPYLRGTVRQRTEGQIRELLPVAAVTYNPRSGSDPDALLPPGWQRRSVLFDADYGHGHRRALSDALAAYSRSGNAPGRRRNLLRLDALAPPASSLDADALAFLAGLPAVFVDQDRPWPQTGLELAALGRAALLGDTSHARAVAATAVDYLAAASTVDGLIRDDWPAMAVDLLGWESRSGGMSIAGVVAAYEAGRHERAAAARVRRVGRQAESLNLIGARGEVVAELQQAAHSIQNVPPARRPVAQGLRDQLGELRRRAGDVKTSAALQDVGVLAAKPLRQAADLRREIDDERAEQDRERQRAVAARQAEAQDRARAGRERQQWAKAATEQARAQLAEVRDARRHLDRLSRRRVGAAQPSPLHELCRITLPDGQRILAYRPPTPPTAEPVSPSLLRKVFGEAPPMGQWQSTLDPAARFPGLPASCASLAAWGPGTQAVIAPAIRLLSTWEEQICLQHGLPRRAATHR